MSDLGSGQTTLATLFTNRAFRVPAYQRNYAWEDRQLTEFADDISNVAEGKSHFLGTFLFMRPSSGMLQAPGTNDTQVGSGPYKVFDIVDGQQRLTTAVLFMNAVRFSNPGLLRPMQIRNFIFDSDEAAFKFQTVPEDWPFLRALLESNSVLPEEQTPSQTRLKNADIFFRRLLGRHDAPQVERWIQTLSVSTILVHAVEGYGEASIIFETVNDRGKRLTDLEGLKSFLMHVIGRARPSDVGERQAIEALQGNFAAIYRMLNRFERALDEDSALRQSYLTFARRQADGSVSYWYGDGSAKDDAKRWLLGLLKAGHVEAAFKAAQLLAQHIQTSFQKIEAIINNRLRWEEIERVLALHRIAGFWPIILNTYGYGKGADEELAFRQVLHLCEVCSLKIWGIGDYRSDKAQSELIKIAQQEGSNRNAVISRMREILRWWDIPRRWEEGVHHEMFYYQGRDARYILFEYENHLRSIRGYPQMSYSDFDEMTIEHIAARKGKENIDKCLLEISDSDAGHSVEQIIDADNSVGSDVKTVSLLHHIGNLVIDPPSPNSQKNCLPVEKKLPWFNAAPYLSQIELEDYLIENQNVWNAAVIRARGKKLTDFAMQRWNENK